MFFQPIKPLMTVKWVLKYKREKRKVPLKRNSKNKIRDTFAINHRSFNSLFHS